MVRWKCMWVEPFLCGPAEGGIIHFIQGLNRVVRSFPFGSLLLCHWFYNWTGFKRVIWRKWGSSEIIGDWCFIHTILPVTVNSCSYFIILIGSMGIPGFMMILPFQMCWKRSFARKVFLLKFKNNGEFQTYNRDCWTGNASSSISKKWNDGWAPILEKIVRDFVHIWLLTDCGQRQEWRIQQLRQDNLLV